MYNKKTRILQTYYRSISGAVSGRGVSCLCVITLQRGDARLVVLEEVREKKSVAKRNQGKKQDDKNYIAKYTYLH